MLLSPKGSISAARLPKPKMRRAGKKLYVKWVIEEINLKRDKSQFAEFTKWKEIIAMREWFLEWTGTKQGQSDLKKK